MSLMSDIGTAIKNKFTLNDFTNQSSQLLTGGGTVSVSASWEVKWSQRFITISNGYGSSTATNGFFDITCPASGTVITAIGGAANKTVTANGIPIGAWESLYYILPLGSTNTSLAANFRVVGYTSGSSIPSNWIKICTRNDEANYIDFTCGISLRNNASINTLLYDVKGSDVDGAVSSATAAASNVFKITGGTASANFEVESNTNYWKYLRLKSPSTVLWDIATKEDDTAGALQFRPGGINPAVYMKSNGAVLTATEGGTSAQWRAQIASENSTADKALFMGTYGSLNVLASHNYARNSWADLYINNTGSTGGSIYLPGMTVKGTSNAVLLGTGTDNGVDRLQVNGSTNTSALNISHNPSGSKPQIFSGSIAKGEIGTNYNGEKYLLLCELSTSYAYMACGKVIAQSYTSGMSYEINVHKSMSNVIIGDMYPLNKIYANTFMYIVTLTYGGKNYLAVHVPSGDGSIIVDLVGFNLINTVGMTRLNSSAGITNYSIVIQY